ncbi:hypothetical protein QO015_002595 [Kaistia geumhonensis]|uniref:Uncharacterized protein n=1 Tax=Kaistia geumhonensis TaxID=410839 RepID=A0ABU0M7N0_9HYPH|nr:hypothetical protein [Kaistia geumhonensis]
MAPREGNERSRLNRHRLTSTQSGDIGSARRLQKPMLNLPVRPWLSVPLPN